MMRPVQRDDALLTAQDVADEYRVSSATVHRWRRIRGLKAIEVGRTIRFRRADVEAFLAAETERQA